MSGPTHISRVIRDASIILTDSKILIYGVPSDISYYGTNGARDVVIFEPPHREKMTQSRIDKIVSRIFRISDKNKNDFIDQFDQLLKNYDLIYLC